MHVAVVFCAKITDEEANDNGKGLDSSDDAVVGLLAENTNETVQHVEAPMPTSNEIQSGGEQVSNEQFSNEQSSSLPLNDTDDTGSLFVVDSGKFVVSAT
jgi:hypothetical protein